jgi:hypothetical protein
VPRRNLIINPALKVDDGHWFPGVWNRTAAAHPTLPRTTALEGTTAGQVVCARADVVAGKYYVFSVSIRAIAPMTGSLGIDWRTSGNVFLSSTSGAGSDYGVVNMTAGSTQRFAVIGQAPTDAGRCTPVINGMDAGGAQVTAAMLREFDTLGDATIAMEADRLASGYFDGDSTSASWDGSNGESTSTSTLGDPAAGLVRFGAVTIGGVGVRTSFGSGSLSFGDVSIATGLIATATYDPRRGRFRIDAVGLSTSVLRCVVYSRPVGRSRWSEVRGGKVGVNVGQQRFARKVDDYEFTAGVPMQYRVVALASAENQPDVIVQQRVIDADQLAPDEVWIKFIAAPASNRRVFLHDWSDIDHDARNVLHHVRGRPDPIAVTDVHSAATMTVEVVTPTRAEREALRTSLRQGAPVFFQTPDSIECPSMYAVVGSFKVSRLSRDSVRSLFTIPLTEVAPPPPSVVGVAVTWASLRERYASWQELADDPALSTWRDVST